EKARRMDLLQYQIEEIEAADLHVGEEEEIASRRTLYRNAEKIVSRLREAQLLLFGGDGVEGALSLGEQAVSSIGHAAQYMDQAQTAFEQLQNSLYEFVAAADEVKEVASLLDFDPREADETENRWEVLRRLFAKYGTTAEEVLTFAENARAQLRQIELSDEHIKTLTEQEQKLHAVASRAAEELTGKRQETARRFAKTVGEQLAFLDMPHVSLQIDCQPAPLSPTGADAVEFLMSANVGEPPKPLSRIASGGELSRIMLAIKSVLADADEVDTLIFDEIDTGISGRAAQKVGIRLRQTAETVNKGRHRQVLCVTHLAQIAARAEQHFLISKAVKDGRTYTSVTPLQNTEREEELARIIGGTVTAANLQAAKEMLQN
ncbi:MAG: DNA repair protein RecN, partial [Clostridia bacterium]|nr:DNA repair protein RecN [Clostridia bacterium]